MNISVIRRWSVPDNSEYRATTTGVISFDGAQTCFSLEPTALMIPAGTYPLKLLWSPRFQRNTPHLLDVIGRSEIEMHGGNVATDSDGCILCAENRLDDYRIYWSAPATNAIEEALRAAEENGETNTISVSSSL